MHRRRRHAASADGPLIGRSRELSALMRAAREAARGSGSVVLVAGEPGIGKSRLAAELARRHVGTVAWGRCWEGDGAPAYWPWVQVLRDCADDAALAASGPAEGEIRMMLDLADGAAGGTGDASRFRLFEGVTRVLGTVARRSPLLVILDDLQWADEPSVLLLRFVAREVPDLPVLIVGAYRDTDLAADHPLRAAFGELARFGDQLALEGLPPAEVGELARSVGGVGSGAGEGANGAADGRLGELLHHQTGGNPFFARELLRLLGAQGRLRADQLPLAIAPPTRLDAVVSRRLARLPHPTNELLACAAVAGATFEIPLLADATGVDPASVLARLEPAIAARLVVEESVGRFGFVHDLVRETLVASLGAADRAHRHRTVAAALARIAGDDPGRVAAVAGHLVAGVAGGDAMEAARWAVRAGERAGAVLAYEEAAAWYERALAARRLVATGDDGECGLLLALGAARLDAGDLPGAREAYLAAAGLARARRDGTRLAEAALGLGGGFSGFEVALLDQEQIDLLEEALAALPAEDSPLRALVTARLSVALSFVASEDRRRALGAEAVRIARRLGDDVVLGYALAAWCDTVAGPEAVGERLAAAEEVMRRAGAAGLRTLELLGRRLRVVALLELGRVTDADVEIDAYDRLANALRQPLYRWYVPLWRATRSMMRGEFAAAAALTGEAERIGALAHSGNARTLAAVQHWVRLRYQGRYPEAADELARALASLPHVHNPAAAIPVLALDVSTGRTDAARDRAGRLLAGEFDRLVGDAEWLPNMAQAADAALMLGHRDLAAAVYDRLAPYAELYCVEGIGAAVYGTAAHYLAELAAFLGRDRDADRHAALAAAAHRRCGLLVRPPRLGPAPARMPRAATPAEDAAIRREGELWALRYAGRTVRLRDSKGLRDLAVLLRSPGTSVHCTELAGGVVAGTGPALDATAVAAYRRRLGELEDDLAAAESDGDTGRTGAVRAEREFLVAELTGAMGLGGRSRRPGDPIERARKAVTARIRDAIVHIGAAHPDLGRHLANSVRTGTFCCYRPEFSVRWA